MKWKIRQEDLDEDLEDYLKDTKEEDYQREVEEDFQFDNDEHRVLYDAYNKFSDGDGITNADFEAIDAAWMQIDPNQIK